MSGELTAQLAATELLRRQRSRASLAEYSQAIDIPGVPNTDFLDEEEEVQFDSAGRPVGGGKLITRLTPDPAYTPIESRIALHHYIMMLEIQKCIETPRGRLMVFAPPGSAKSTYASVVGVSWALGRKRNQQIILASYGSSIAAKQSRKVRTVVKSTRWSSL